MQPKQRDTSQRKEEGTNTVLLHARLGVQHAFHPSVLTAVGEGFLSTLTVELRRYSLRGYDLYKIIFITQFNKVAKWRL